MGYFIYASSTGTFGSPVNTSPFQGTTCAVTSLNNGTPYYFEVTAAFESPVPNHPDQGPPSSEVPGTPEAVAPAAPTGLTAAKGDGQVSLSWTAPASDGGARVSSYNVYDGTTADFTASAQAPSSAGTSTTVTGLTNGTPYFFWVTAVNTIGQSPASSPAQATPEAVLTAPGPPTGLTARAGDGQVSLSWTAPASDGGARVSSYNVYDGTTADFTASILAATSAGTGVIVTGLTNGTVYDFWVTALSAAGQSRASNWAKARPVSGSVPVLLIAVLAAVAAVAVAGALTLVMRGRRLNSRSPRHVTASSQVRAEPGPRPRDSVNVRETGSEPTHTIRFEPDRGTTITTIKEKS